jgi:hypothetical protein
MIEVTKFKDQQFPIGCVFNGKPMQKFTLKDAKELRMKLADAIEWAVNMDDLRKENKGKQD